MKAFNPNLLDFEQIKDADQFARKKQSLRERRKPPEVNLEAEGNPDIQSLNFRIESTQKRLNSVVNEEKETIQDELKVLSKKRKVLKSKQRIEVLKDLKANFQELYTQLKSAQNGQIASLKEQLTLDRQTLSELYRGDLIAESKMEQESLSPMVDLILQKLMNSIANGESIKVQEKKVLPTFKLSKAIHPMEKVALIALNHSLNQLFEQGGSTGMQSETSSSEVVLKPLPPEQLKTQLFKLRNDLKACKESTEKDKLKQRIRTLEQQQNQTRSQKRLLFLQRAFRTIEPLHKKCQSLNEKLQLATSAKTIPIIQAQQQKLRTQLLKELTQLMNRYSFESKGKSEWLPIPLLQHLINKLSRLAVDDVVSFFEKAKQKENIFESSLKTERQMSDGEKQMLGRLMTFCLEIIDHFHSQIELIKSREEWLSLLDCQHAVASIEEQFLNMDKELQELEKQLTHVDSSSELQQLDKQWHASQGAVLKLVRRLHRHSILKTGAKV